MRSRNIGQRFRHQLQEQQVLLQRVFRQRARSIRKVTEKLAVVLEVPEHQVPGQIALAVEMVEEATLRDARLADDFLDRGSRVAPLQDNTLGRGQFVLARLRPFCAHIRLSQRRFTVPTVWFFNFGAPVARFSSRKNF
jgi:hypothetical protein